MNESIIILWQQKLCNLQQLKIAIFTYRSPHFCFPWRRLCDYHAICYFPSYSLRCLSQCVSPKIAIFTTFLFLLGTPLGQSRQMLYGWKDNSMLTNCLAACAHLTITVSEIQRDICEKIVILSYPLAFDAPSGDSRRNIGTPLWCGKTRMVSLPNNEKISKICLFVLM